VRRRFTAPLMLALVLALAGIAPALVSSRIESVIVVHMRGKQFVPPALNAHAGDVLKLCNLDPFYAQPFSYSSYSPWGPKRKRYPFVAPGKCESVTLVNPTSHGVEYSIRDVVHSQMILRLAVYPKGVPLPAATPRPAVTTPTTPPPSKTEPSELTLLVGSTKATATTKSTSAHVSAPQVAAGSLLTIKAVVDHPLPTGWKLVIYHNGDPLSQGNGVYYKVCEIDGASGNTQTSCGNTRPTLPYPVDDVVFGGLTSTAGPVFNVQVDIPVR
jgi:hypothetical protein